MRRWDTYFAGTIIVAAILLFLALFSMPYGYYILLRFVVCGVSAYGTYFAVKFKRNAWAWTFGIIAILFNPIIPIHLDKDTWAVIDVAVAGILLVSLSTLRQPKPKMLSMEKDLKIAFEQGLTAMRSQNFIEACHQFSRVIEAENSLKSDAHYNLAICFFNRKNFGLAAEHYQIFCTRQPKDVTPHLLELIEVLRKADKLSPEEGERLFQNYENASIEQQSSLKIGNTQIYIDDFLEKVDDLVHKKLLRLKSPFDEISKSFSVKIPIRVYSIQAIQNIVGPAETFAFCDAFTRYGVAVALVLLKCGGKKPVKLKKPPYYKSHEKADLSRRCPWNWLFVEYALLQTIDLHARNFVARHPGATNSIDSIKEQVIKEFVYEGFSIGLESAGY